MIYTSEYDESYRNGPAIPVVELKIIPIGGNIGATITAMVDSGADATILPRLFLENAGAEQVGRARMRWGNERGKVYDVYLAVIEIGPFQVHGIRILADREGREAILGRDALNQLVVTLNGLANMVEISQ
ncbi:MAG: retroviral-like aspartic protease family protein [Anaerolineae bacterium]|nr:retroviral-like aspartic protease family protein [Anaerolineae bacterium]